VQGDYPRVQFRNRARLRERATGNNSAVMSLRSHNESVPLAWRVRNRLPKSTRKVVRRVADSALRPWGSLHSVRRNDGAVALTFDDGPDPANTPAVLAALHHAGVTATFFVLAERAAREPELAAEIAAAGHELALHGMNHDRITQMDAATLARNLDDARHIIERISSQPVRWFRPPFGAQSFANFRTARSLGLDVVMWSHQAEDWLPHDISVIATRSAADLRPGGILLLHDTVIRDPQRPTPITTFHRGEMTAAVLSALHERNLKPMSVGQLVDGAHRIHRSAWFRG
jgi:peptidoglycan/xylan/chitin deacetylase (PgdA/CDA1 family)